MLPNAGARDSSLRFAPFRMTGWRYVRDGAGVPAGASPAFASLRGPPLRCAKGTGPPPSPLLKEGELDTF